MENITLIGIDTAKHVFELCAVNHVGRVVARARVARDKFRDKVRSLSSRCVIAMESCGTSGFWGREFTELGYEVKLIAPQHVKPFRKSQKNDRNDAEAIAEAAQRPTMRFVEVKSLQQVEMQTVLQIREQALRDRTALVNQLHGFFLQRGIVSPRGIKRMLKFLREGGGIEEGSYFSFVIRERLEALEALCVRINSYTIQIEHVAKTHPICRLLRTIPGIGPISSVAFMVAIPGISAFKNGRDFAAWLGIVPQQHSSGGRTILGSITKRGDSFLRKTLIHGARAVLCRANKKNDALSLWAVALKARKGTNLATVALANKLARILYAVLRNQQPYQVRMLDA